MLKYLCAPLAMLALAAAGCGGDSTPSKSEFIADLDAICSDSNKKIRKLATPLTVKQIPKFVRDSRPLVNESIAEAQKLELPDEDARGFRAYISESKRSLSALDELEQAAKRDDKRAVGRLIKKTGEDNEKRDKQAKKLGLKDCGSG